jgi:fermentation-respiration switch protein FrsA (DUF1100 family)
LLLLTVVAVWWTVLYFGQRELLFPRGLAQTLPEARIPARAERLWVELDRVPDRVEAWLFLNPKVPVGTAAPLVVYFHGNAETIDQNRRWAEPDEGYPARGFHVLLVEYRGYGRSGGLPSEAGIVADSLRLVEMAMARAEVKDDALVLHGRSLGTAVAAQVAAQLPPERRPRALVLDSPFTSVADFAWRYGAPRWLVRDRFDTVGALQRFAQSKGVPILIYHSTDDEIVPFEHGRRLAAALERSELVRLTGSHLDDFAFDTHGREVWEAIDRVLERAGLAGAP